MPFTPAEQLLKELGIRKGGEIDVEAMAYYVGALVRYRRLKGCEARIVGYGDRAVISVNSRAIPTRRRFSAAHELGHWHHHRGRSSICRADDIGNRTRRALHPERVADAYAADLLMPRYLFEPMARRFGQATFKAVDELRAEFRTSITATAIRLVEQGPEPAMLICHTPGGRKWFARPRQIPERWFPNDELDGDGFAIEILYGSQSRSRRALMGADAWFSCREAQRYQVYEESNKVSEGEVLTILTFKDEEMLDD